MPHPCIQQPPRALPTQKMMACGRQTQRDRLLAETGSMRLLSYSGLCPGALELPAHPDTNLGMKKYDKAQEFFLSRKDVGIILCSSSSEQAARRERLETV